MEYPSISDSEWVVASVVWLKDGQTSMEIAAQLPAKWKLKTINTFLTRLVSKGVLKTEKQGRAFRYHALYNREQCVRAESASFLQRIFGGAVVPLVAHFCEVNELTDDELTELRKILNKKSPPAIKPAPKPPKPPAESDQLSLL